MRETHQPTTADIRQIIREELHHILVRELRPAVREAISPTLTAILDFLHTEQKAREE